MELTRPRKMELLHTPKLDLLRMMREDSLTLEDVIFLFASNKIVAGDIRMNAPTICDKLLTTFLHQTTTAADKQATTTTSIPSMAA
jgi:hypothetical protein